MKTHKKVALIGLGPHAMRIYYPYLGAKISQDDSISLELLIDLEENRDKVQDYLQDKYLQPTQLVFLPNSITNHGERFSEEKLDALFKRRGITHVIVSTEPKAHKAYLEFCIKRDLAILTDKPVTSPLNLMPHPEFTDKERMFDASLEISKDVKELIELLDKHPKAKVIVQTQRRYHEAYELVFDRIRQVIAEFKVPITYIDIYHSDGMWNMPKEFLTRENHPYKYGYGKLMHSGYHFIDLLRNFVELNCTLEDKQPDTVTLFSHSIRPIDNSVVINEKDYARLFGEGNYVLPSNYHSDHDHETYGELDNDSQWQFSKNGRVITTAKLSLLQSGFSLRAWPNLPKDTYKSNGRVRHERVNIHVGPLFNIQVHSYQATQVGDEDKYESVGSKNHFDIYIFRNTQLIGGKPLEIIEHGKLNSEPGSILYMGQNEQPRFRAVDEFLGQSNQSKSDLRDHMATNRLMGMLYSNQARQNFGQVPFTEHAYKEIFHE